jgi:hypothetical protein
MPELRRQSCVASRPARSSAGEVSGVDTPSFQAAGLWPGGTRKLETVSVFLSSFDQAHESNQHYGSESGNQYGVQEPAAHTEAQKTHEPAADNSSDDAQQYVADHAKAGAAHDLARQPTRNQANDNPPHEHWEYYAYHTFLLNSFDMLLEPRGFVS